MPVTHYYKVDGVQYEFAPCMSLQDFSWYNNMYLDTNEKIEKAKNLMRIIYNMWLDDEF